MTRRPGAKPRSSRGESPGQAPSYKPIHKPSPIPSQVRTTVQRSVRVPKKHQPLGFEILYEDSDLIIGNKAPGYLTVAALWERENTIHHILNSYVRKGSSHSKKCVFVVHRLDQATSGVLIFAKTPEAQQFLKEDWKSTEKIYFAIVHGKLEKKRGLISSYLSEDEDYMVHSSADSERGKLAETEYEVVKESSLYSLVKIHLLTGKKNQIRVHLAGEGHPIVGDTKYGAGKKDDLKNAKSIRAKSMGSKLVTSKPLMLHSYSVTLTHPFTRKRLRVQAEVPAYFNQLVSYQY